MSLPQFFVLSSKTNFKYVRYVKEGDLKGQLQASGADATSPLGKFEVEPAECGDGLVHIRSCYHNKYWSLQSNESSTFIVAEAEEKDEDKSERSCTLFRPAKVGGGTDPYDDPLVVQFCHAFKNHNACVSATNDCLYAKEPPTSDSVDVFTVIDWETIVVLPRVFALKADNGNYVSCSMDGWLTCSAPDIGDQSVRLQSVTFEQTTNRKSRTIIKSVRNNQNWIARYDTSTGAAGGQSYDNPESYFTLRKIDDNIIALRSQNTGKFLRRNNNCCVPDGMTSDLACIMKEACFEVEETVLRRRVQGLKYRLEDARIYGECPVTMATQFTTNDTNEDMFTTLTFSNTVSQSYTWHVGAFAKVGIKVTTEVGIPLIVDGAIEVSGEIGVDAQYGQTVTETNTLSTTYTVKVPAMNTVKVELLATKGTCDVPFAYSHCDTYTDGQQPYPYKKDDGGFTGVNCYNFYFKAHPMKLATGVTCAGV